jgi:predicted ferric reductase
MQYSLRKGINWLLIYLFLALLPLIIAKLGPQPQYRGFWMELGVAMGFIGLGILGLQCLFTGRFRFIAPNFGMDNILQYHRELGIIGFLFVLAHPIVIFVTDPEFLYYFDPGVNAPRALGLMFATVAIILIIATSLWRLSFRLNYENWRLVHGALSLGVVVIGAGHAFQVAHYLEPVWKQVAVLGLAGIAAYLVVHSRLTRPWINRKRPYVIDKVIEERCQCQTLVLKSTFGKRMNFIPGQFAWITVNDTPFSLQQNPYSIASSSRDKTISFTSKELGDFSGSWKHMKPGQKVFLEGPYGSFTPKPDKNLFLIMGGIGVTPAMSMLRTMADENDKRRAILIYGNKNWDDVLNRSELEKLSKKIDLKIVHLLEEAPEGWEGETGYVTQELIEKYLPENAHDFAYFICGPKPIMDVSEISLRNLGIDWRMIYTERFEII